MVNNYTLLADLKSVIDPGGSNLPSTDSSYDTILGDCIARASRLIDSFTRREPGAYAATTDEVTRYFSGQGDDILLTDEFLSITSVAVAETGEVDDSAGSGGSYTTYAATDYIFWPFNASSLRLPYSQIRTKPFSSRIPWPGWQQAVKVVGRFGFAAATTDNITPIEEIENATITQAVRLFKRAEQAYVDVGAIEALQQLRYVKELDPDVKNTLYLAGFCKVAL